MNCRDYQQMISKLVDLELKATASGELFEHLGRCAECREFLDHMMKLNLELDKAQVTVGLERGVGDQLLVQLDKKAQLRVMRIAQTRFDRWRTAAVLALMVLITGLFWSLTLPTQGEDRNGASRETPQTEMPNYQP